MIKLINPSGGETWVADNRLEEYLAIGFRMETPPKPKAAKKTVKK